MMPLQRRQPPLFRRNVGAPVLAAVTSGGVNGFLSGTLFAAVGALEEPSVINLASSLLVGLYVSAIGAVVALIPAGIVAHALLRVGAVSVAPVVGAGLGLVANVGLYWLISMGAIAETSEKMLGYVGFGLAGLVGGFVGGVVLARTYGDGARVS